MANITISSATVAGWQGNSSGVKLRVYTNDDFIASDGSIYPKSVVNNPPALGTFFQEYACSVSSGSLVIPAVTLDSTTDSTDNPDASYSAVLWDSVSGTKIQQFGTRPSFTLQPTPVNITWSQIFSTAATE